MPKDQFYTEYEQCESKKLVLRYFNELLNCLTKLRGERGGGIGIEGEREEEINKLHVKSLTYTYSKFKI